MSPEAKKRKRQNQKRNRRQRLESTPVDGWKKCSEFHYQKVIAGKLINWWPSRSKCMIDNQIYRVFCEHDMLTIIQIPKENL